MVSSKPVRHYNPFCTTDELVIMTALHKDSFVMEDFNSVTHFVANIDVMDINHEYSQDACLHEIRGRK